MTTLHKEQIAQLESLLLRQKASTLDEIRDHLAESKNEKFMRLAGHVHDLADEAVADLLTDLNVYTINRLVIRLKKINDALIRIQQNSYGTCAGCGKAIPLPRLMAAPTAVRCVECQIKQEAA